MIGRWISKNYELVGGHIYFGDDVIKLNMDILRDTKEHKIEESDLFESFQNILPVGHKYIIAEKMPLLDHPSQRLMFITRDTEGLSPRRLLILPYLHER